MIFFISKIRNTIVYQKDLQNLPLQKILAPGAQAPLGPPPLNKSVHKRILKTVSSCSTGICRGLSL